MEHGKIGERKGYFRKTHSIRVEYTHACLHTSKSMLKSPLSGDVKSIVKLKEKLLLEWRDLFTDIIHLALG